MIHGSTEAATQRRLATQALAAQLPARIAASNRERRLSDETVSALRDAGLLRLLQPRRWGGAQAPLQEMIDLQNLLAQKCLSTAWVFGVLNVQSFMLSLFDQRAQQDVWGEDPQALLSSSFLPMGRVQRVDEGFRISGQWPYSSGCAHAQWALVGGMVPPESPEGEPEMRVLLLPRADIEVVDTWRTFGLRGTGSNDLRIENAFVPEHRSWRPAQGLLPSQVASADDSLYGLPWLFVFTSGIAAVGVGGAQGALAEVIASLKARQIATRPPKPLDAAVLGLIAQGRAELDEMKASLRLSVARMSDCAATGESMGGEEGWQHRVLLTSLVRRCHAIVDRLMLHLGARSVVEDHPVTQFWLDLAAARAHPGNDPAVASQELARLLFA